ncbi:MAG: monofunctional biosynthetic peptidoglycan transglycosylase [Deltaproteobacteria bacterium]
MKKAYRKLFNFILKILIFVVILSLGWVLLYKYVDPPLTPLMVIGYFGGAGRIEKGWRDYNEISGSMKMAVISAEDQKFPFHDGFDIESIEEAIDERMKGDRLRGASSISQQTAKNVFLWPSRSWLRKGIEAYFTFLIEKIWGKKRILEVYLNVIETGKGIYGVERAGEIYFGKSAKNLNQGEAALIAVSLPNPRLMSPAKPSTYMKRRAAWVAGQMNNLGGAGYLKNIN